MGNLPEEKNSIQCQIQFFPLLHYFASHDAIAQVYKEFNLM